MASQTSIQSDTEILRYSHTVGLCVMQDRGFMFPVDTLVAEDGRLHTVSRAYFAAASQLRVTVYDKESEYYGVYGGFGDEVGQFKWPTSIASDKKGRIYISDEQLNRINIFENDGDPISYWGVEGSGKGELLGPSGLAFDADDNLFVSDQLNNRIQKFSKNGLVMDDFRIAKDRDAALNLPWGLTVAVDGFVYVADWGNHCVKKYSPDGSYIAKFGSLGDGEGQFKNPSCVAVDSDGYIYVADWGHECLQILDSEGRFISKLRGQATISKWGQEYLDSNYEEAEPRSRSNLEPSIDLFGGDPHEESAHIEKYFWGPTSVKLDQNDNVYITESNRHRVQIYNKM